MQLISQHLFSINLIQEMLKGQNGRALTWRQERSTLGDSELLLKGRDNTINEIVSQLSISLAPFRLCNGCPMFGRFVRRLSVRW